MPELTVMKYNRLMMAILGVNPYSFASLSMIWLGMLSPFFIVITLFTSATLAALYAYRETRLSLMVEAVAIVICALASVFAYLNMIWQANSVGVLNLKLQKVVDQGRKIIKRIYLYFNTQY